MTTETELLFYKILLISHQLAIIVIMLISSPNKNWQSEAIENSVGCYNSVTGKFEWVKK